MKRPMYAIGIGASGVEGLDDICRLLERWPESIDASVFVVLHRSSDKVSYLAKVLRRRSRLSVVVATNGMATQAGVCYVAESSQVLYIDQNEAIACLDGSSNRYRNRTVDVLFASLAASVGRRAIGIVLSGSLADGSKGLAAIHQAGGLTMVLDPGRKPRGMQQNAIDYDGPITYIESVDGLLIALDGDFSNRGSRR
ncbi:hypothetical protein WM40_05575 [Robbsia andropogonis]|uniref:protein-glutamate methylesterase n=1 Tax=Robbsia andropogonis TaxID=28092 RepID=A0A0F5K3C8_9BURK|nr:chemotaxis protein CheB [Robbsia andropogonis]KKB64394.1 hypothetical protein WM40_05575 [Robbsia andropogonis]MCP1118921.1 chemotaxis protein CheB [Robbsia andropogonis]MCP1128727.1 chemotaxis protein CheB [Robbsia andropogonis]